MSDELRRPDIGACYCLPDAPNRCRWDSDARQWVGPCVLPRPEHVRVTFAAAPIPLVGVYTPRPCSVDGCAGVACVAVEDTWYCPPHAEGPLNRWFDRPSRETA